ncbi:Serine/threonine-protein kinase PLK1-like, protein [Aphelenchoides fujianensis]|nr:Serine/threonine-protein kinase PLK1-like, protein [Aphelenchoides fujianensis]
MTRDRPPADQPALEEAAGSPPKRRRTDQPAVLPVVVTLDSENDEQDAEGPPSTEQPEAPSVDVKIERLFEVNEEALEGVAEVQSRGRYRREKEQVDALAAATTRMAAMERRLGWRSENQLRYIDATGAESFYATAQYAHTLEKKDTLLKEYRSYMMKYLLSVGERPTRGGHEFARSPCLSAWFRTNSAIVLMMTDGTEFHGDHTKLIISPSMQAVTFIDPQRRPHTYRLQHLADAGCSRELHKRLKYAKTMVDRRLSRGNTTS